VRSARLVTPLVVMVLLSVPLTIPLQQIAASQLQSSTSYTNDAAGFWQFVQNILATPKSGDQEKLAALIKETEIPDYSAYLSALYGQEGGDRVASAYARDLQTREMEFQEYLTQLAQQPDAEYFTLKLDGDAQRKRFLPTSPASWIFTSLIGRSRVHLRIQTVNQ